jgi:acylphosphatase
VGCCRDETTPGWRHGRTVAEAGTLMVAKRLIIAGRVQGVGYRAWMVREAKRLGVSGWVRNRRDGSLEALVDGDTASVEELLRLCRRGPPMATVIEIVEELAEPCVEPGFGRMPTA